MDSGSLYQQAKAILNSKYIPNRDQTAIHQNINKLEGIILSLQNMDSERAELLTDKLELLYRKTEVQRKHPRLPPELTKAYDDITKHLVDALESISTIPIQAQHYLVPTHYLKHQKQLSILSAETEDLKHINYSLVPMQEGVQDAMRDIGINCTVETIYRARLPNTPAQSRMPWNLKMIGLEKAHKHNAGGNAKIGVMDTGIDYTHPQLAYCTDKNRGYNFIDKTPDFLDRNGHGTHVSGIIAGADIGVAPNAKLYGMQVLNESGKGGEAGFLRAGDWAIDQDLDIINGSFGGSTYSPAMQEMMYALHKHDITFVASAGNDGDSGYHYPACYETVISVAAVDRNYQRAPFSQINDKLTISAPGVKIYSSIPGGFKHSSGTSMSAPHVSGSLGILHTHDPRINKTQRIIQTAFVLGKPELYGAGLIMTGDLIP